MIHDKEGRLTKEAAQKVIDYLRNHEPVLHCCKSPQWSTDGFIFGDHTLTVNPAGKSVIAEEGIPTIAIVCGTCGQLRSYMASKIFPEWLAENKAE